MMMLISLDFIFLNSEVHASSLITFLLNKNALILYFMLNRSCNSASANQTLGAQPQMSWFLLTLFGEGRKGEKGTREEGRILGGKLKGRVSLKIFILS